ncbi:MAG: hypothetical protein K6G49_02990 [Candidatus Saccharibacteria bacterium]|nr:hypothetical protein [Candidatus Saccharibacteria bacterium]
MSKLFRIVGYFEQDDGLGQIFVGEVVMGELPIFWGRCEELGDGDTMKAGATSYLAGGFSNRHGIEFYFYKMYDNPPQDMLLCMIENLKDGQGVWATREKSGGNFVERNLAEVKVEELPYSSDLEQQIYSTFSSCPALAGFPEMLAEAAKTRKK